MAKNIKASLKSASTGGKNKLNKVRSTRLAIWMMVVACVLTGINAPVIHHALQSVPIPLYGFLRIGIPLLILAPIMFFGKHKRLKPWHIAIALLYGLAAFAVANGLFYMGIKRSGTINAAIIGLLEPLLLFTFSVEIMREKFNPRVLGGIAIALGGSLLVVFAPIITHEHISLGSGMLGNILLVGSVCAGVASTWLAKIALRYMSRIQLLFWGLVSGVAIYGVISIGKWGQIPSLFADPATAQAILYGAVIVGIISYLAGFYAISRLKGEELGLFQYIQPATAAVVAAIFFGEQFTPVLLLGVVAIFTGLYIAEVRHHKELHAHLHFLRNR